MRQGDAPFQSRAVGPLLGDEVEPLEVHPGVPVPGVAEHEHAEGLGTAPQRHDPVVELPDGQVDELLVLVVDEQRRLEVVLGVRDPQAELLAGDGHVLSEGLPALAPRLDLQVVGRRDQIELLGQSEAPPLLDELWAHRATGTRARLHRPLWELARSACDAVAPGASCSVSVQATP